MAELKITLADGRTLRQRIDSRPMVIGREGTCDIPLDDPSASRRHARFVPTPEGVVVEDMGSKNGTLINDAPSDRRVLRDGDRILLGSSLIVFHDVSETTGGSVVIAEDDTSRTHATRYVSRDTQLNISQRRLHMLYELGGRLTTLRDRENLLDDAVKICCDMLQFERAAIGVRQRQGRGVDWPVVHNLRGAEGELTISRTLLSRAMEHGERAIFTDAGAEADPTISMVQHGIRSAMCVPMIHEDKILGVLYGDRVSTSSSYTDEDIDFFAAIAQQVGIGLINARLMEDRMQMIRLENNLSLARAIQTGLLPSSLPQRPNFTVAAINEPGDKVSGDYYDVIERPDGRIWCLMADVTGEGIPAAMLMANLQAAVRMTIEDTDDPAVLLNRWNLLICRNTDASKFITCGLALIDPDKGRLTLASAGHCMPIILRPSAPPLLIGEDTGFPLGIVEKTDFPVITHELGPEPCLFLAYTDGVYEAMNASGEPYGMDRLLDALKDRPDLQPQGLVKHLRKTVTNFVGTAKQSDDLTIMAARIG